MISAGRVVLRDWWVTPHLTGDVLMPMVGFAEESNRGKLQTVRLAYVQHRPCRTTPIRLQSRERQAQHFGRSLSAMGSPSGVDYPLLPTCRSWPGQQFLFRRAFCWQHNDMDANWSSPKKAILSPAAPLKDAMPPLRRYAEKTRQGSETQKSGLTRSLQSVGRA